MKSKARREAKYRRETERMAKYYKTLEFQLCEVLQGLAGERGHSEGAVDTLLRIIHERDQALLILALDRLRNSREAPPECFIQPPRASNRK